MQKPEGKKDGVKILVQDRGGVEIGPKGYY